MNLAAGSTVRLNGRTGVVEVVDSISGRIAIRWDSSGNLLTYSPADIAKRFQVGPAPQNTPTASQALPRPYARRCRCPNPRDCGDPTCQGDCGY